MPKRSIQVRSLEDGFIWRDCADDEKILGSSYPRGYYLCVYKHDKGCQAAKQVQRSDTDPELYDVVYYGEHTCTESVHSSSHHTSVLAGVTPPVTSESLVTYEAISSSSTAGTCFSFPATSADSQVTHEGGSRSTVGVRMSPGTSGSQVTPEEVSGSTVGFWSMLNRVESMLNSPVDYMLDVDVDDYVVDEIDYSDSDQIL